MLLDLYIALTTSCSPYLRNMGYLNETIDMQKRAGKNRTAWQPHLDATQRYILSAVERCQNKGRAVILGSGLMLDLPLAALSSMFHEVILKDVICLPAVRKELQKYSNATFLEHDVTGVAGSLYRNSLQGISELPEPARVRPSDERDADLVVSLNILSQLWVIPRAFAAQRLRALGHDQVDEWCGRITEAHYASLRSLSCAVCLIADHAFVKKDGSGRTVGRGSTIGGLGLPAPGESWTWNLAPLTRDSPDLSKELVVGAWYFPSS